MGLRPCCRCGKKGIQRSNWSPILTGFLGEGEESLFLVACRLGNGRNSRIPLIDRGYFGWFTVDSSGFRIQSNRLPGGKQVEIASQNPSAPLLRSRQFNRSSTFWICRSITLPFGKASKWEFIFFHFPLAMGKSTSRIARLRLKSRSIGLVELAVNSIAACSSEAVSGKNNQLGSGGSKNLRMRHELLFPIERGHMTSQICGHGATQQD